MDCWIGVDREGNRRIVRLAGRLTDAQVPELLRACAETRGLELNLTDLVSADAPGIEAIRRIRIAGALLVGTHGYMQIKLDSPSAGAGQT